MRSRLKNLFFFCVGIICMSVIVLFFHQTIKPFNHPKMMHKMMRHKIEKIVKRMNLDENKAKKMRDLLEQHSPQMKTFILDMQNNIHAMNEVLKDPNSSEELIINTHEKIKGRVAKQLDSGLSILLELRKILTPEEYSLFLDQMRKNHPRLSF